MAQPLVDYLLSAAVRALRVPPDGIYTVRQVTLKRGLVEDHLVGPGARAARGLVLKQPSQILELGAALPASALVAKRTTARHAPARPTRRGTQMPIAPTVSAVPTIEEVVLR